MSSSDDLSDLITLYEAYQHVASRTNARFGIASRALRKALHLGQLAATADLIVTGPDWEPDRTRYLMPNGRPQRTAMDPALWGVDDPYWGGSMLCNAIDGGTEVYGNIRLSRSALDQLWPDVAHTDPAQRLRGRLAIADAKLFPRIEQEQLDHPELSIAKITEKLAREREDGKQLVKGVGSPESRAKRLARNYGKRNRPASGPKNPKSDPKSTR